jgi:hypothetical protein
MYIVWRQWTETVLLVEWLPTVWTTSIRFAAGADKSINENGKRLFYLYPRLALGHFSRPSHEADHLAPRELYLHGTIMFHNPEAHHQLYIIWVRPYFQSRDSAVGIAICFGLDDRLPVGPRNFSPPRRSDRPWGPPNLLTNGYRGLFLRG